MWADDDGVLEMRGQRSVRGHHRPAIVEQPDVALAVPDIQEARRELDRMGVAYFFTQGIVGPESQQIFLHDPFGNMIELHQAGTCRCITAQRPPVDTGATSAMS